MKQLSLSAFGRHCLLAVLLNVAVLFSVATVSASEVKLSVPNTPHLNHARVLVQAALKAGGLDASLLDTPDANEPRGLHMIISGQVHIDMVPATPQRLKLVEEGRLRMIPVPLDRGLLGYRVGVVVDSRRDLLAEIRSLEGLRRFTVGQGEGWKDLEVYRHANIPTREIKNWTSADFARQMQNDMLDFFPLGVEETFSYFLPHYQSLYPHIVVEPHLLIRYPWFRFVWVSPKPEHDEVYTALQDGFEQLIDSGEFLNIWQQHRQVPAEEVFANRNIIDLANPFYNLDIIPAKWLHLLVTPVQP